MSNITAFILGISHPSRISWLKENVVHLEKQNFPFAKKIISIDQFNNYYVDTETINFFENLGWVVLLDNHRSRTLSMDRAFQNIETEFMFYNEDDVLSNLPKLIDLETIFNTEIDGRKCGMISMTLGGTIFDPNTIDDDHRLIGDLKFINKNTLLSSDEYDIFLRMESYANSWFFEFPGLFIRTNLFKTLHENAKNIGGQVEQALTKSYFDGGFDKIYFKTSICKKNSFDILKEDCMKINSHCRLLINLDPNQGNSPLGGNHNY